MFLLHRNPMLARLLFELFHDPFLDLSDNQLWHNVSDSVVLSLIAGSFLLWKRELPATGFRLSPSVFWATNRWNPNQFEKSR